MCHVPVITFTTKVLIHCWIARPKSSAEWSLHGKVNFAADIFFTFIFSKQLIMYCDYIPQPYIIGCHTKLGLSQRHDNKEYHDINRWEQHIWSTFKIVTTQCQYSSPFIQIRYSKEFESTF